MRYVSINPRLRIAGRDEEKKILWWSTAEFISHFTRMGQNLNTGLNVFIAKSILDSCDESMEKKLSYVAMEDAHYEVFMQDLRTLNFQRMGLSGISLYQDLLNMDSASKIKPEHENFEYLYPDPAMLGVREEDVPTDVVTYVDNKLKPGAIPRPKFIDFRKKT